MSWEQAATTLSLTLCSSPVPVTQASGTDSPAAASTPPLSGYIRSPSVLCLLSPLKLKHVSPTAWSFFMILVVLLCSVCLSSYFTPSVSLPLTTSLLLSSVRHLTCIQGRRLCCCFSECCSCLKGGKGRLGWGFGGGRGGEFLWQQYEWGFNSTKEIETWM